MYLNIYGPPNLTTEQQVPRLGGVKPWLQLLLRTLSYGSVKKQIYNQIFNPRLHRLLLTLLQVCWLVVKKTEKVFYFVCRGRIASFHISIVTRFTILVVKNLLYFNFTFTFLQHNSNNFKIPRGKLTSIFVNSRIRPYFCSYLRCVLWRCSHMEQG